MRNNGIKGNLFTLVVFMLVFMVGMGTFTLYSLNSTSNQGQNDVASVDKYIDLVDNSRNIQVNFKKQVQSWKDILIRGLDQVMYTKYFSEFTVYNKDVLAGLAGLKTSMVSLGIDTALVNKVSIEINQLQTNYTNALKRFDKTNIDSYKIVDTLVKGMDRPPTNDMDALVKLIRNKSNDQISSINLASKSKNKQLQVYIFIIIFISICLIILLALLISEIQKKHYSKLKESNLKLKKEIKDRLLAEDQMHHFVYYDELTDLCNRKKLLEDVEILMGDKNEKFAVFFIDLDNFKNANDNYGHGAGDIVLTEVAERLKLNTKSNDIVSRIGGDEFIVIIRDLKTSSNALEIAEKLVKVLSDAFIYNDKPLYIGASVGISIFPEHGTDVDTLIKNADLAMYEVKNSGGYKCTLYNNRMNDNNIHKLETEKNLKNALDENEFVTYYQPIIDLNSMKVLSAESLIRWKRGKKIIQPTEFIPIAKKTGKMVEIDNWMLNNACAQCKEWQELGLKDFSISVNTSYKQLTQLNFVQLVMNILDVQLLDPRYLNLEITEDEAIEDIGLITKVLLEFKSKGVKISMDDFGTGYSSLSYLSSLPIDTIKIDRSLIINLDNNPKNVIIIKSIIAVANSLNIKVIAEGIETKKEFDTLKKLRCDYIQGYLIGKPMQASNFQHEFIKIAAIS